MFIYEWVNNDIVIITSEFNYILITNFDALIIIYS